MNARDTPALTGAQLRAARALLGISAKELAALTRLGIATIQRAEKASGAVSMTSANTAQVLAALDGAGVVLIPENGGGPGVRLKAPTRPDGQ